MIVQVSLRAFQQVVGQQGAPRQPPHQSIPETTLPEQPRQGDTAEDKDDLLKYAPGISHLQDMKYLGLFSKQKSPPYDGKKKGIVAEEWLLHIEKILKLWLYQTTVI